MNKKNSHITGPLCSRNGHFFVEHVQRNVVQFGGYTTDNLSMPKEILARDCESLKLVCRYIYLLRCSSPRPIVYNKYVQNPHKFWKMEAVACDILTKFKYPLILFFHGTPAKFGLTTLSLSVLLVPGFQGANI